LPRLVQRLCLSPPAFQPLFEHFPFRFVTGHLADSNLLLTASVRLLLVALKPLVFEILLALATEPRHGWSLVREVETRLGPAPLLPGNFYRTLRRMLAEELIEEAPAPAGQDKSDERRRYFRLTALGERVARDEARRLHALFSDARVRRLLKAR